MTSQHSMEQLQIECTDKIATEDLLLFSSFIH